MEWQGCWATKGHVVGEVVVAKEAEFTTAKKKKKIMMAYKILGGRLIFLSTLDPIVSSLRS
jgi:hypothetical protein